MTPARLIAPWWRRPWASVFGRRLITIERCAECGCMTIDTFNALQRRRALDEVVCVSRIMIPPFAGGGRVCVRQHLQTWA